MGLPSFGLGKKSSTPAAPAPAPATLAPPPAVPSLLANNPGVTATNAARRARKVATASGQQPTTPAAPVAVQVPQRRKLFDAGRAAMGLY